MKRNVSRNVYKHCLWCFVLAIFFMFALTAATPRSDAMQQRNDWRVGNTVYLSQGTQIRHGPGFSYCYHTIVPEDNWAVVVIGGPHPANANGRTWYDTSRRAAGDPAGGTGWVNIEQVDASPVPQDPGEYCPAVVGDPAVTPVATPTPTVTPPDCEGIIQVPQFLTDIKRTWEGQLWVVKLGVLALAFALLFTSNRWGGGGDTVLMKLVRAVLWGVLLGGVADLTRPYWLSAWTGVAGNSCGLDPAMVLLVAPFLLWAAGLLLSVVSRAISIAILAVIGLALLAFLAPDRFNALISAITGLLRGGGR